MKVLGLHYDDPHPVHEAWMEEVGDVMRLEIDHEPSPTNIFRYALNARKIPDDYNVLLCEGGTALRTAVVKKLFNPEIQIIRLLADEGLYECVEKQTICIEERITHHFVDGAIAVSEFARRYGEHFIDGPIEIVHPFVSNLERYLSIEKENFDNKRILFVGYNNQNKNIDALVRAVKDEDWQLDIVGQGHREYDYENITTHGFVENILPFFEKASLYVQPSDGDTFPVSTLEAMAAGLPTVVTEATGTKSIVHKINSRMVSGSKPRNLKETIKYYFSLEEDKKLKISQELRNEIREFREEVSTEKFREQFSNVV